MKPITHLIKLFTPERVPSIRLSRELQLREGHPFFGKGAEVKTRAKKAPGAPRAPRKPQAVVLKSSAQAQLEALDPITRSMFEQLMKGVKQ